MLLHLLRLLRLSGPRLSLRLGALLWVLPTTRAAATSSTTTAAGSWNMVRAAWHLLCMLRLLLRLLLLQLLAALSGCMRLREEPGPRLEGLWGTLLLENMGWCCGGVWGWRVLGAGCSLCAMRGGEGLRRGEDSPENGAHWLPGGLDAGMRWEACSGGGLEGELPKLSGLLGALLKCLSPPSLQKAGGRFKGATCGSTTLIPAFRMTVRKLSTAPWRPKQSLASSSMQP
mmetsp:Transcript_18246/g.51159  ORF Transcript_18246/g.51159 Transcript_18246/m.51159 type:complete len:229 (+) Transcript_18246:648-1334(+)